MEGRRAAHITPFISKLVIIGTAFVSQADSLAAGPGADLPRCRVKPVSELRQEGNSQIKSDYCEARTTFFTLHRALDSPPAYRQECELQLEDMAQIAAERNDLSIANLEAACVHAATQDMPQ